MFVRREYFKKAALLHQNKARAVNETPLLVSPLSEKLPRLFIESLVGWVITHLTTLATFGRLPQDFVLPCFPYGGLEQVDPMDGNGIREYNSPDFIRATHVLSDSVIKP
jgi:hypothetical protein